MQSFTTLLAIGGLLMTLLLGFLAIMVLSRGVKVRATGLGTALPQWPGVPAGWLPTQGEPILEQRPTPWPEGQEWTNMLTQHRPEGAPTRPHMVALADTQGTLLFLPGRFRGINGWWVVLL